VGGGASPPSVARMAGAPDVESTLPTSDDSDHGKDIAQGGGGEGEEQWAWRLVGPQGPEDSRPVACP